MSHEIRSTPMNAILGLSHLLSEDLEHDVRSRDKLSKIGEAANHLLDIVNDVLDLSRIETGNFVLESVEFSPVALLDQVRSQALGRGEAKGLSFSTDGAGLPPVLIGDPNRLRQALLNYVGNAIKFTERGSVEACGARGDRGIRARTAGALRSGGHRRRHRSGHAGETVRAVRASRRIGLASTPGSGLGLAITRGLAHAMGGDAGVLESSRRRQHVWFSARSAERPT